LQVNQYTPGDQTAASVASDHLGNGVVLWQSFGQDGDGWGVYGRRFSGSALGPDEFPVNQYTLGDQTEPRAAWDARLNFVVVWNSWGYDPQRTGIFARRFNSQAEPLGDEFRVDGGWGAVSEPTVAMDAGGDFVVAWT
jgi:hypothetical protein